MSSRTRTVVVLALPIIGGMVSQNILNLVDTGMVGTLGDAALAAVGLGGFVNFTSQALIQGLSSGVQAMAARRKGEGRDDVTAYPLNAGLLLSVLFSIPVTIALWMAAPHFFPYLNDDPKVLALVVPYYRCRVVAVAAVGMNFSFRGYWNGVSLSQLYLRTLLVMHVVNVILNYALIYGEFGFPRLGVVGAGIGTATATWVGTGTYLFLASRYARGAGFLKGLPDRPTFRSLLRLSIPNGIQTIFFAAGLTALFWIVGQVGTTELAAAAVLINVMLVVILPGLGMGLAAASLVGQALGRGDPGDAAAWGWDVTRIAMVGMTGLGALLFLFPDVVLSLFLHDPETLAVARLPLQVFALSVVLEPVGMVLSHALLGAGDNTYVMAVSVISQWLVFLPIAWYVGPYQGYGLLGIWICQAAYRALQAMVFAARWRSGRWKGIEV